MEYFWGARVSNGSDCTVDVTTTVLNVTQACLEPDSKGSTTLLVQTPRFEEPFPVCTLRAGQVDHCGINQTFYPGDEAVKFSVRGKGVISITGIQAKDMDEDDDAEDDDDEESEADAAEEDNEDEDDAAELEAAAADLKRKANAAERKRKGKQEQREEPAAKRSRAADGEPAKKKADAKKADAKKADAKKTGKEGAEEKKEKKKGQTIQQKQGIRFVELQEGSGPAAKRGKKVKVRYTGWLTSGKQFDKGTIDFKLAAGDVIPGWDIGVDGMRVGGKRRLLIPPKLAYGSEGAGDAIPPNAQLIFEVQLLKA